MEKQNIIDLEKAITALQERRSQLVLSKQNKEIDLSALNNKVRSATSGGEYLPPQEYRDICSKQKKIKQDIYAINVELQGLKFEIQKKNTLKDELSNEISVKGNEGILQELIDMKDYYATFAADTTRVSSMRAVAAGVTKKLDDILTKIKG